MSKKKHIKKEKTPKTEEVSKLSSKLKDKPIAPWYRSIPFWLFFIVSLIIIIWQRLVPLLVPDAIPRSSRIPFIWDPDTCYHIRRIFYIAQHHMNFAFYDPLLAYPHGAVPVWSPLYDWILALPSFLLSLGNPSENFILYSAIILNLIFAISELLILGLLVYKATKNTTIALLAATLIGISGPQVRSANWQILDHDSLLLFLFSCILYAGFVLFSKDNPAHFFRDVPCSAIIIALFFWVWPGSYIHIAVMAIASLLYVILSKKLWLLSILAQIYIIAGALVSPLALIHLKFSKDLFKFEYVSFFTVFILWSIGLFFYIFKLIWEIKNKHRVAEMLQLISFSLLLIVLLYFSLTPLKEGAQFAAAQDTLLPIISESQPLFHERTGPIIKFTMDKATDGFGYLVFLFPVAFLFMLIRRIKMPIALYSLLIVSSIILGTLAVLQMKYAMIFSVPFGIVSALFFQSAYDKIAKRYSTVWLIIFTMVLIVLLIPIRTLFEKDDPLYDYAYHEGFTWLKNNVQFQDAGINSPPIKEDQPIAASSIMIPWDMGHLLHLYSGLPSIADNFTFIYLSINPWEGFYDMARFFFMQDEDKAIELLKKYKCSYVVVPQPFSRELYPLLLGEKVTDYFEFRTVIEKGEEVVQKRLTDRGINTIAVRLSELNGSANPAADANAGNFLALKHFRLLHETPGFSTANENLPPGSLKIYKYVEGTTLNIPVQGNPDYKLEGLIIMQNNRNFLYRQNGHLSDKIIVPYPTRSTDNYPYAQYYKVEVNGASYEFYDVK